MFTSNELQKEPLPGYHLVEPIGRGGFGEVWKCEAPGGLFKAMKFVHGNLNGLAHDAAHAQEELRAIEHIKSIRHPFLLSIERVENIDGQLIILMELADKSLHDLFLEYRKDDHPGIPRSELLRYLKETAEVLDLMRDEHGLQHLDIKPQNIFLVRNHVKVADFGLVQHLADAAPVPEEHRQSSLSGTSSRDNPRVLMHLSTITPLYASPELFQGIISHQSDQYSLAIVYQELLTGVLPFKGTNSRQLALAHSLQKPDLQSLSPADRRVVAKAMAKAPDQRFETCTRFIEALEQIKPETPAFRRATPTCTDFCLDETRNVRVPAQLTTKQPKDEKYLPGYQFLSCRHRSPNVETWEAYSPIGKKSQVRFLYGLGSKPAEKKSIEQLRRLRHPTLLELDILPGGPGALILLSDLVEDSLRLRYQLYQAHGDQGIPRNELLTILEKVAWGLDELAAAYRLHHLELSPRNILLADESVLLDDFGLAQLLWLPVGHQNRASARYSAPEVVGAKPIITPTSDQYSLAMIYQEMLTGSHPYRGCMATVPVGSSKAQAGKQKYQLASLPHTNSTANLDPLPRSDRRIVAQALRNNPEKRFSSCTEFVEALRKSSSPGLAISPTGSRSNQKGASGMHSTFEESQERIAALVHRVQDPTQQAAHSSITETKTTVSGRKIVLVALKDIRSRIESFCQDCNGEITQVEESCLKLKVPQQAGWFSWLGGKGKLQVEITWKRAAEIGSATEISAQINCEDQKAMSRRLREECVKLLETFHTHLEGNKDRRGNDRVFWPHDVEVRFLKHGKPVGEPVHCQGKDLSPTGIGFFLTSHMLTSHVQLKISHSQLSYPITVRGNIVRAVRCNERLFEIGARFEEDPLKE